MDLAPPLHESIARSYESSLYHSLRKVRHFSFVVTDPHLPGHPIVYASDRFLQMCGYPMEEALGRNPKFLQGPDTDRRSVLLISDAVREQRPCHLDILNYTKQGSPYWITFHMAPVFSGLDGHLLHFVGMQIPISCNSALPLFALPDKVLHHKAQRCAFSDNYLVHTGQYYNGQKKKKTRTASIVLELLIHEFTSSIKPRSVENRKCRSLCEIPRTTLCPSFTLALSRIQQSFVLSDPNLPDIPVVYASDMFLCLTGYQRDEVLGRNCRFLQGPDTDINVVQQVADCIKSKKACTVRLLNYRKDKSSFWNLLHVALARDHNGKLAYLIGVQADISTSDGYGENSAETSPLMQQMGAVGAIKVALRALHGAGLYRVFP